jgi:hypothetical protein
LGIVSIVLCCCYGIGIVPGIIAIVLAGKDKKLYNESPEVYTEASFKNLNAGRICAIIGLILGALYLVYIIAMITIFGFETLRNPQNLLEKMKELQ